MGTIIVFTFTAKQMIPNIQKSFRNPSALRPASPTAHRLATHTPGVKDKKTTHAHFCSLMK